MSRRLPHEGTEPGAIACDMFGRYLSFGPAATVCTPAFVRYPVRHLHRDRGQFQHLMRVVRRGQGKRDVATGTPLRPERLDRCGRQEPLVMAWMAWFPTRFAGRC